MIKGALEFELKTCKIQNKCVTSVSFEREQVMRKKKYHLFWNLTLRDSNDGVNNRVKFDMLYCYIARLSLSKMSAVIG